MAIKTIKTPPLQTSNKALRGYKVAPDGLQLLHPMPLPLHAGVDGWRVWHGCCLPILGLNSSLALWISRLSRTGTP